MVLNNTFNVNLIRFTFIYANKYIGLKNDVWINFIKNETKV